MAIYAERPHDLENSIFQKYKLIPVRDPISHSASVVKQRCLQTGLTLWLLPPKE